MKKVSKVLSLMLLLSLVLSGCGVITSQTSKTTGNNTTEQTENTDGTSAKDRLVVGSASDIDGMDPQNTSSLISMKIVTNIYDTLYKVDQNGDLEPVLAESYETSEDGTEYTFKLKQGVMFHNGEELKASDVVYTIERGIASPYAGAIFGSVKGAEALSDYEVKVTLKYAYAPFIYAMCAPLSSIVNEKAVEEGKDTYSRNPVGTGAYEFVSWDTGSKVILKAFDQWHGGRAPIENVEFRVLQDTTTSVIALENKEIDLLLDVPTSEIANIEANSNLALYECSSHRYNYVGFNTEAGAFGSKEVRQAVAYAISREDILLVATEGVGNIAQNHLTDTLFGYSGDVTWYEQDVEKAKSLMASSGVGAIEAKVICKDETGKKIAQVVQEELTELGITCKIDMLEGTTFTEQAKAGNYDIIINNWSSPVADADYSFGFLYKSSMIGAMNLTRFNNAEMDSLISDGETVTESDGRKEIYKEALSLLKEECPTIPVYWEMAMVAADKDLKNVVPSPSSTYYFYDWSW